MFPLDNRGFERILLPRPSGSPGLDVGFDTRTGVDDRDYRVPFRFTGTITKVTFKPGPPQFTPEEEKRAAAMRAKALD